MFQSRILSFRVFSNQNNVYTCMPRGDGGYGHTMKDICIKIETFSELHISREEFWIIKFGFNVSLKSKIRGLDFYYL